MSCSTELPICMTLADRASCAGALGLDVRSDLWTLGRLQRERNDVAGKHGARHQEGIRHPGFDSDLNS